MSTDGGRTFTVVFETAEGEERFEAGEDEYVLSAARRAGYDHPSMCEQGWCTTCAVKVLSGELDQSASRRYYEADREAGFGLICTGTPRSDLRLRPRASPEMREHRREKRLPAPRATGL